jgi:ribosomal protein L37AE/L43A
MAKDINITYLHPKVDRTVVPEVFQHCNNCKTETVHKKVVGKKILICITCKKEFKHS